MCLHVHNSIMVDCECDFHVGLLLFARRNLHFELFKQLTFPTVGVVSLVNWKPDLRLIVLSIRERFGERAGDFSSSLNQHAHFPALTGNTSVQDHDIVKEPMRDLIKQGGSHPSCALSDRHVEVQGNVNFLSITNPVLNDLLDLRHSRASTNKDNFVNSILFNVCVLQTNIHHWGYLFEFLFVQFFEFCSCKFNH